MEALRTSTVPSVAKTPNDSPGRSYMRTFNATPSTYNVPMVSSTDETDVVRMPRLEADGPFQADVHDVDWQRCVGQVLRGQVPVR